MNSPKATAIRLLRESAVPDPFLLEPTVPQAESPRLKLSRTMIQLKDAAEDSVELDLAALAIENAPDGIVIATPPRPGGPSRVLFANNAWLRMTGAPREEVIGEPFEIFRVDDTNQLIGDPLLHPLRQNSPFRGEAVAQSRDGREYFLDVFLLPLAAGDGEILYWIAYLEDISDRKAQVTALEQQALHDMLTHLPNRTLLMDRITQAIRIAKRAGQPVALMVMDLDGFKEVNDTMGHHSGDLVLQQVARRLHEQIRESDTVARLGGDEFAFVLPTARDANAAYRVARKILIALESPFVVEDQKVEVGASIGIALFPEHGPDAETLMRRADTAMYHAKRKGLQCTLYASELEETGIGRATIGAELRVAIEKNELELYYQPKIHLRTGLMTRVEALVRWNHPERGFLSPDTFIPAAEKSGLIRPLTEWVIHRALQQCREWQNRMLPIHVAINLSTKMLQEHTLPQIISDALDRWKLPAQSLKLEITESSIMADPPHAFAILALLQSLGVRLSLDDFGTGYSSLMHLRQLPVDEIKIDKSFVMGMATSAGDSAIVRATIDLAHNLGMQVVGEGVDNEWTCKMLTDLGCDLAQGYFLSAPLPAKGLEQWLAETGWGLSRWETMLKATPIPQPEEEES